MHARVGRTIEKKWKEHVNLWTQDQIMVAFAAPFPSDIRAAAQFAPSDIRAAAGGSAAPIAAMGIIASVQQPLHADPSTANARQRTGRIAWVYVLTPSFGAGRSASNATVIVPCTDGWTGMFNMKKRTSCLCKTLHWLQAALPIFPTAAYIGKVEDDAIVNEAALLRDLEWAWRQAGHCGSSGRGNGGEHNELQWYGKFDWAAHEAVREDSRLHVHVQPSALPTREGSRQSSALRAPRAKYCGGGDNLVTRHKPPLSTCGLGLDRPTVTRCQSVTQGMRKVHACMCTAHACRQHCPVCIRDARIDEMLIRALCVRRSPHLRRAVLTSEVVLSFS